MKLRVRLYAVSLGTLAMLFASAAWAQQEGAFPGTAVSIVVTAEPHHGSDAPELRAQDVTVMQGSQRDHVVSLEPLSSSQAGVQLFFLIDDSLSSSDLGTKLNDLRSFINAQPAGSQIGVAYMRNGTAMILQNLTANHSQAAHALRLPTGAAGSSGSPYFSLQDLLKRWPQGSAARQVVMISDGIDSYWDGGSFDDPYVDAAIAQAQRAGVVVNAIYARGEGHFGHTLWRVNWGQNFLSQVADSTGGEAYFLANDSPVSFTPYLNQIAKRMQHQYLLTFKAQPGSKSGMQPVKVKTEVPNVELVAQSRVFVPAA
jgi:hypothetical protein